MPTCAAVPLPSSIASSNLHFGLEPRGQIRSWPDLARDRWRPVHHLSPTSGSRTLASFPPTRPTTQSIARHFRPAVQCSRDASGQGAASTTLRPSADYRHRVPTMPLQQKKVWIQVFCRWRSDELPGVPLCASSVGSFRYACDFHLSTLRCWTAALFTITNQTQPYRHTSDRAASPPASPARNMRPRWLNT